jgi:hypothetical protein
MKSIEQAVVDALPHRNNCPGAVVGGKCRCGSNGKRAILLAQIQLNTRARIDAATGRYVYLR